MGKALTAALDAIDRVGGRPCLRAVDYLRVSTEEQAKGYGIAAAAKKTARFISQKNWEHVDTFKDEGVSGSLPWQERDDLPRLMALARQEPKPFDVVVVSETRAIGRKDRVFFRWVWELQDLGIHVAIVDKDIDNTTEAGEAELREEANYAFKEYTRIRVRTQAGIQEKALDEGYVGGKPRFGYRVENQGQRGRSRLVLDECDGKERCTYVDGKCAAVHETRILRTARELVVQHKGDWHKAALDLNEAGLLTRSGIAWKGGHLRLVLMSEDLLNARVVFRSDRRAKKGRDGQLANGESVTIPLDPVFTEEEIAALRQAVRPRRGKTVRREAFILSKRITSLCGSYYVGRSRHYVCHGKPCTCPHIPADQVEAWAWGEVTGLLGDAERLKALAEEWVGLTSGSKVNHLERIAELDRLIEEQDGAIAVTMAVAAQQAARRGLAGKDAEASVTRTIAPLSAEVEKLTKSRAEVVAWQAEARGAAQRAKDLQALAERAQHHLGGFTALERADFLDLLNIQLTVRGQRAAPSSKGQIILPPMDGTGDIRPGVLLSTDGHMEEAYSRESTSHVTFRFSMALTA
jgi:DNA invertase Pin-like site-specific DNA recombinase